MRVVQIILTLLVQQFLALNQFNITNVTNFTNNNNGTVTPNTPTNSNGTSCVVTFRYKNSEQTLFSNKTINLSVGVAVQGSDGSWKDSST